MAEWIKSGQFGSRAHLKEGHLTGYTSWCEDRLSYGIVGVVDRLWKPESTDGYLSPARADGAEAWARKQVEAMLLAALAA